MLHSTREVRKDRAMVWHTMGWKHVSHGCYQSPCGRYQAKALWPAAESPKATKPSWQLVLVTGRVLGVHATVAAATAAAERHARAAEEATP